MRGRVRRPDGSGIGGAALTLVDYAGRQAGRVRSGSDGSFTVPAPGPGSYLLIASAGSYQPAADTVLAGPRTGRVEMVLSGAAAVHGLARAGQDGHPVRDARVTLVDAAGNVAGVTHTDHDGRYRLSGLTEGDYTVIAAGYPPAASTLRVSGSEPHTHDVLLGHPGPGGPAS